MRVKFNEVAVVSDLYEAGRTEDGVPFIAEVHYLQVTKPNGERWDHYLRLPGCEASVDEEWGVRVFADTRVQQLRRAARLRRAIRRAGRIDTQYWSPGRPVYGSSAYCSEDEIALEHKEAEEEMFR